MSTMRCCSAWNVPIGTPNWRRVFRYSSVVSHANFIAPTASAQESAAPKSSTSSSTPPASGSPLPSKRMSPGEVVDGAIRAHLDRVARHDAQPPLRSEHDPVRHRRADHAARPRGERILPCATSGRISPFCFASPPFAIASAPRRVGR